MLRVLVWPRGKFGRWIYEFGYVNCGKFGIGKSDDTDLDMLIDVFFWILRFLTFYGVYMYDFV